MKKYLSVYFFICFFPTFLLGQSYYMLTDSSVVIGEEVIGGGSLINSKLCRVKKGNNIVEYTPFDVKEYGLKDGTVYRSFNLNISGQNNKYFLEILAKGKINLYYLHTKGGIRKYFINTKDSLIFLEVPQKREVSNLFFNQLVGDCSQSSKSIPLLKIRKNDLKRFINNYNSCSYKLIPVFQCGLLIGMSANNLKSIEKGGVYSIPETVKKTTLSLGAYIDIPIKLSNFSIHTEIYFKRINTTISFTNNIDQYYNNIGLKNTSLNIPLLFRYSMLSQTISPFIQLGPIYSRALENNCIWNSYKWSNNIYVQDTNYPTLLQTNLVGISIGGGFISNAFFGEIRINKFYNFSNEKNFLELHDLNLLVGYIF